ncbi:MAG TPA: hypothetical protein PLA73_07565, partial [Sedimentibacter sp.]|nr:hypothetical protein [Sedimentibacter sp.]
VFFLKNSGRSFATNSQFIRPKGVNKLVNETARYGDILLSRRNVPLLRSVILNKEKDLMRFFELKLSE